MKKRIAPATTVNVSRNTAEEVETRAQMRMAAMLKAFQEIDRKSWQKAFENFSTPWTIDPTANMVVRPGKIVMGQGYAGISTVNPGTIVFTVTAKHPSELGTYLVQRVTTGSWYIIRSGPTSLTLGAKIELHPDWLSRKATQVTLEEAERSGFRLPEIKPCPCCSASDLNNLFSRKGFGVQSS